MALIVQKYGGTSVGNVERIKNVARRVAKWHDAGHQVVVVLSAMSGETNRLQTSAQLHRLSGYRQNRQRLYQSAHRSH
jgi:aspartate kinase